MNSAQLLHKYSLISDQVDKREVAIVLAALERTAALKGDVVEFGCYIGTTSLFISRLLNIQKTPRAFFVYDSFEGLPEKTFQDHSPAGEQFTAGELSASKKQFIEHYKKAGLQLPRIYKGWFDDIAPEQLPDTISFAFLDGDYYSSIKTSLRLITPRLVSGAVIVVDDYANEALPGASRAVDEWRSTHECSLRVEHSMAILSYVGQ